MPAAPKKAKQAPKMSRLQRMMKELETERADVVPIELMVKRVLDGKNPMQREPLSSSVVDNENKVSVQKTISKNLATKKVRAPPGHDTASCGCAKCCALRGETSDAVDAADDDDDKDDKPQQQPKKKQAKKAAPVVLDIVSEHDDGDDDDGSDDSVPKRAAAPAKKTAPKKKQQQPPTRQRSAKPVANNKRRANDDATDDESDCVKFDLSSSSSSDDDDNNNTNDDGTSTPIKPTPIRKPLAKKLRVSVSSSRADDDSNDDSIDEDSGVFAPSSPQHTPMRLMAFQHDMYYYFANGDQRAVTFLNQLVACTQRVNEVSIDVSAICFSDHELMVLCMMLNAVQPMRRVSSIVSTAPEEPRETIDMATVDIMRSLCARLYISFDTYVVPHFRVEGRDFENCIYRVVGHGVDGALSFNVMRRTARFWFIRGDGGNIGHPPIRPFFTASANPPPHFFVSGASEYAYRFDEQSGTITISELYSGAVVTEMTLQGIDLQSHISGTLVPYYWRNATPYNVRNSTIVAAPAVTAATYLSPALRVAAPEAQTSIAPQQQEPPAIAAN